MKIHRAVGTDPSGHFSERLKARLRSERSPVVSEGRGGEFQAEAQILTSLVVGRS